MPLHVSCHLFSPCLKVHANDLSHTESSGGGGKSWRYMSCGAFGVIQELGSTGAYIAARKSTLRLHFEHNTMTTSWFGMKRIREERIGIGYVCRSFSSASRALDVPQRTDGHPAPSSLRGTPLDLRICSHNVSSSVVQPLMTQHRHLSTTAQMLISTCEEMVPVSHCG